MNQFAIPTNNPATRFDDQSASTGPNQAGLQSITPSIPDPGRQAIASNLRVLTHDVPPGRMIAGLIRQ